MSRLIYTNGLHQVDWASDVLRILLERSTSSYSPDRDHDFLSSFTGGGGVEISVASYARKTLANAAKNVDDTKNQMEYDCDDVAFGSLESGQTVKSLMIYKQVGGSDATPADDPLIYRDDGKIDVVLAADAAINDTTLWVEPIEADIPSGSALDFGGGATCTLSSGASRGDRSLSTSAIAAAATAGDVSSDVDTDSILPAVLQNGPFNVQINADGLIILTQRGLFAT